MTILFNNLKILCLAHFWSIFLIFGAKIFFLENLALPCSAMDRPYFIGPFRLPPTAGEPKLFISFSSFIACFKTTDYIIVFFMRNVNIIFLCFYNFHFYEKNNRKSIDHVVNFSKLVLRVLKKLF